MSASRRTAAASRTYERRARLAELTASGALVLPGSFASLRGLTQELRDRLELLLAGVRPQLRQELLDAMERSVEGNDPVQYAFWTLANHKAWPQRERLSAEERDALNGAAEALGETLDRSVPHLVADALGATGVSLPSEFKSLKGISAEFKEELRQRLEGMDPGFVEAFIDAVDRNVDTHDPLQYSYWMLRNRDRWEGPELSGREFGILFKATGRMDIAILDQFAARGVPRSSGMPSYRRFEDCIQPMIDKGELFLPTDFRAPPASTTNAGRS